MPPAAAPPETAAPAGRLAFLDGLRALAALLVVLHHAWLTVWPVYYSRLPPEPVFSRTSWLLHGRFAVDLFIVLSGFCLALPVVLSDGTLPGGVVEYFKRRAWRILPPYYAALVLSLLLIAGPIGTTTGTQWDLSLPVTPHGLALHLFMAHGLDPVESHRIDHPMWSVAVECQIYLVFPVLVAVRRRFGDLTAVATAVVAGYAGYFLLHATPLWATCPDYLALFALGTLAAEVVYSRDPRWQRLRAGFPWRTAALAAAGAACAVCWVWGWRAVLDRPVVADLLAGVAACCLLVAACRPGRNVLRDCLSWRPLAFVGGFSYSLYLIHAPLLQVAWQYGVAPLGAARPM
jgi:peptidoglycan/LPS O-acetylase OafA/YrhL